MSALKYFFTFTTGIAFGLVTGYMAGSQKDNLVNSRIANELQTARDALKKAAKEDYETLKKEYNKRLNEALSEIKAKLDQSGSSAKTK